MSSNTFDDHSNAPVASRFLIPFLVGIPLILTIALMWASGLASPRIPTYIGEYQRTSGLSAQGVS